MACKDGVCQEEGDGDSDAPRFYSDPLLLYLFGDLVSVSVRGAESGRADHSTRRGVSLISFQR